MIPGRWNWIPRSGCRTRIGTRLAWIARSVERLAVSVAYIRKDGRDFIGWNEVAGVYRTEPITLTDGRVVQVQRLISPSSVRRFRLTNPDDYSLTYNGLVIAVDRRRSRGWQVVWVLHSVEGVRAAALERDDRRGRAGRHRRLPARLVRARGHVRAGSERSHQRRRPLAQRSPAHAPDHDVNRRATYRLRGCGQPAASQWQALGEDGSSTRMMRCDVC